jgi:hypothetical protein
MFFVPIIIMYSMPDGAEAKAGWTKAISRGVYEGSKGIWGIPAEGA